MYANFIQTPPRRSRRSYSKQLKLDLIQACQQPGISIAAVALANGLNANLLRRWVKEHRDDAPVREASGGMPATSGSDLASTLIPVALATPLGAEQSATGEIKIEIQRAQRTVTISWPASQADSCAMWLRELLR